MDVNRYLKVKSGTARIEYPLTVLFRRTFLISIEARNLVMDPGIEIKNIMGDQEVIFDKISAKLLIRSDQKVSIEFLDADSKTIQFHLGVKTQNETR